MHIEVPDIGEAPAIADLWAELAADQRQHGSHVDVAANREAALESVSAHTVADELFVARAEGEDGTSSGEAGSRGALLGFVMFGLESDRFVRTLERGVVHNVYVVPGAREAGVGSALLEAAERALADRGAEVIVLSVLADNDDARRLYRERGYDPHRLEMERSVADLEYTPAPDSRPHETGESDRDKTE